MPFVKLEISRNLFDEQEIRSLLSRIEETVVQSLSQLDVPVKSTVTVCDTFLVGDGKDVEALCYVTLKLFRGRPLELRQKLCEEVCALLKDHLTGRNLEVNVAVDLLEIDRETTKVLYLINGQESPKQPQGDECTVSH